MTTTTTTFTSADGRCYSTDSVAKRQSGRIKGLVNIVGEIAYARYEKMLASGGKEEPHRYYTVKDAVYVPEGHTLADFGLVLLKGNISVPSQIVAID